LELALVEEIVEQSYSWKVLSILDKNFSASPSENNRCLKTMQPIADCKMDFFYI
jgi:hypothetical protein